jgi:hypothetical protein
MKQKKGFPLQFYNPDRIAVMRLSETITDITSGPSRKLQELNTTKTHEV